jgi:hypothetical protein
MDIPILIEPLGPTEFRATIFHLSAEGATADEAKLRVQAQLDEALKSGGRVMTIRIPVPHWEPEFPVPPTAGDLKDNPHFDEWMSILAENRRRADEDPYYDAALHAGRGHPDPVPEEAPAGDNGRPVPPG